MNRRARVHMQEGEGAFTGRLATICGSYINHHHSCSLAWNPQAAPQGLARSSVPSLAPAASKTQSAVMA